LKAVSNLFAGGLADRFGRKRILVAGWLVGVLCP
jgi:MFS family permease